MEQFELRQWRLTREPLDLWFGRKRLGLPKPYCLVLARLVVTPFTYVPRSELDQAGWGQSKDDGGVRVRQAISRIGKEFRKHGTTFKYECIRGTYAVQEKWTRGRESPSMHVEDVVWLELQAWLDDVPQYRVPNWPRRLFEAERISPHLTVSDVGLDHACGFPSDIRLSNVLFREARNRPELLRHPSERIRRSRKEAIARIKRDKEDNHKKSFFVSFDSPVSDRSDRLTFWGGTYDFAWSKAFQARAVELQQKILKGLNVEEVPRRLDNVVVVVTEEEEPQLVLALRGKNVETAHHWMVTAGESCDPTQYVKRRKVSIESFVRRTLTAADELHVPKKVVADADIRVLGIATEWNSLYGNLLVYASLPISMEKFKGYKRKGEFVAIDGISFTPRDCLELISQTTHSCRERLEELPLVPVSVIALLLALLHRFGEDAVRTELQRL